MGETTSSLLAVVKRALILSMKLDVAKQYACIYFFPLFFFLFSCCKYYCYSEFLMVELLTPACQTNRIVMLTLVLIQCFTVTQMKCEYGKGFDQTSTYLWGIIKLVHVNYERYRIWLVSCKIYFLKCLFELPFTVWNFGWKHGVIYALACSQLHGHTHM